MRKAKRENHGILARKGPAKESAESQAKGEHQQLRLGCALKAPDARL
jgi:hypothetical protein